MLNKLEVCNDCPDDPSEYEELEAHINAVPPAGDSARPVGQESIHYAELGATQLSQWATVGEGVYRPSGKTIPTIPPGVYTFGFDQQNNLLVLAVKILTDDLVILPDTASQRVLTSINQFWSRKEKFKQRGQLFKRGIMLWGPAGSGKTATIMLLTNDLIKREGIVVYANHPEIATRGLKAIRQVEPTRPLICVLEDIDEIVTHYGEHALLSLLDGEMQTDNVVFLATTNYPDRLAKRIINRPSRFDEVIKIGMPSSDARQCYLRSRLTMEELSDTDLEMWVADTSNFSVAHLKELMVCVFCLDRDYRETLDRLRQMEKVLNSSEHRTIGLTAK